MSFNLLSIGFLNDHSYIAKMERDLKMFLYYTVKECVTAKIRKQVEFPACTK